MLLAPNELTQIKDPQRTLYDCALRRTVLASNEMSRFDEIEAEFHHIMDELKRVSDFQDRRLLLRRMLELLREANEFESTREQQFREKWGKPPQV